ncbi:M12 family metallo-peptidase [Dokdonella sp.]|uniref:M12 family metallo-peptidase n=1 Tax=Dokdonella sp. TaxID=2291710 RepID=UPI002610C756|nr:M12 family metallo-peptidase [Dokdonella sp.]
MRNLLVLASLLCSTTALAARHELALSPARLDQLGALATGSSLVVEGFPDGHGGRGDVRFTRIDVYAPGARLVASGPDGEHELPRSERIELIGSDDSGRTRVHLAFDPGFRNIVGAGSGPSGTFSIAARDEAGAARLVVQPTEEALPPGVRPEVLPTEDGLSGPQPASLPLIDLGVEAIAATPRGATVAVDVDHELLVNRFGGTAPANLTAATNWIADLFATMNVMYVRDLNVTLQQGTTIFRTGATPYVIKANQAADGTDLNNFGAYWLANHAAVPRAFAMLLSGQLSGGFNSSGIAWINSYCQKGTTSGGNTYGSYSVTKVFTSAQVGVDLSARVVGHELGHNFGAAHTHCTNASTGAWPSASGTIDMCRSGESMNGGACYSGTTSCPASGPGAPAGTLMSYCNMIQCGSGGQNVLQFHPTQVTTLSALIAQNTPACILPKADPIFRNGFDG